LIPDRLQAQTGLDISLLGKKKSSARNGIGAPKSAVVIQAVTASPVN